MALEVFWGSGSGPAWRVLLALAVKKVPYESHLLSFSKGEHRSDAMMAISPRGKVPAIRDGAFTLSESLAIVTYLDRKYPSPPLFGETCSWFAPPPTSRKFAGATPCASPNTLMMSIVDMARPAPFTRQPTLPSSAT